MPPVEEDEALSRLIGAIYDAALDPGLWPAVLRDTAFFLNAHSVVLGSFDALQAHVSFDFSWGDNPEYTAIYRERYAGQNPFIPASLLQHVGDVAAASSHPLYQNMLASQFYRDWVEPQGLVDAAQAILEQSGTALSALIVMRDVKTGLADEAMLRRMSLLVPHFRRSVLIGKAIDLKTIRAAAFAEAIDALPAGIFLVDRRARIGHANMAGEALLRAGAVVRRAQSAIAARDDAVNRALQDAIALAGREADIGAKGTVLALAGPGDEQFTAHVLPLASGARRAAGAGFAATAAIFIRKSPASATFPAELMRQRYRLTSAEIKVCRLIVEGRDVRQAAETLGLSPATVRTHLHRIFQKTGARRQAELVALVAPLAEPFVAADMSTSND